MQAKARVEEALKLFRRNERLSPGVQNSLDAFVFDFPRTFKHVLGKHLEVVSFWIASQNGFAMRATTSFN